MPNTYTQIHIQLVFAVKYRAGLIDAAWKEELHKYITGIVKRDEHKMLQVNSMPDHIHILIGLRPHHAIADVAKKIKTESSKWVKEKQDCSAFAWQEGYGAFSYSKSHVDKVILYIQKQETHHHKKTFLEEYVEFLEAFEVEYEEQFIFKPLA
jgi:putative transposase